MEINKYQDITGVVTGESMVEGRMVLLVDHSQSYDYGSREDLPAVRLPNNSTEAAKARFCVTFAVDNSELPLYEPYPTIANTSLRYGFDGSENVPFDAAVHLTHPGNKIGQTIPSGALALAFGPGVFTVPSGAWVYSASVVKGEFLAVANTADDSEADAGKLKYSGSASFAEVIEVDSDLNLTFRTLY